MMGGLDLCESYYREVAEPVLRRECPEGMAKAAAGLAGEGSECLGFDDAISADHDFGPGFCLWLSDEDAKTYGARLQAIYNSLPADYRGYRRITSHRGRGRIGVMTISGFYGRFIGAEIPPKSNRRFLLLPEHLLCAAVSGRVFDDPTGSFSAIRSVLRGYYPEDVRIKKIAARASDMARSGQYGYARCMRRGDTVAASIALADFLRAAMQMVYLTNHTYSPYYKWMYRGLKEMAAGRKLLFSDTQEIPMRLPEIPPLIQKLSVLRPDPALWNGAHSSADGVNPRDPISGHIETICRLTVSELRREGLTDGRENFLEIHADRVMERIRDPELRQLPILAG